VAKTRRSSYGDGGLFKRADGLWVGTVELPSADGSRKQKRVYAKNRNECKRKRDELRAEVAMGMIPVSSTTTVAKWLDYWLAEIKKPHIRPNTFTWYAESVRLHIVPHIGTKKLRHLTAQHVREMLASTNTKGNAERAHKTLKTALKDAITEGLLRNNVCDAVSKPEHIKRTRGALTADDAKAAIRAAIAIEDQGDGPRLATRWAAALLTGARPGELLGLEWDRVDLDAGVADLAWQLQQLDKAHGCGEPQGDVYPCGKVRPSFCPQAHWDLPADFEYRVVKGSLVLTRPKSQAGTRIVPLVEPLRVMLAQHREYACPNPFNLVWHRPDGNPITRPDDGEHWRLVLEAAELSYVEPYSCRHTAATLLQELGISPEVRMAIMGQNSAAAHQAYIHVNQTQSRLALDRLAGAILVDG
jgi:integrase